LGVLSKQDSQPLPSNSACTFWRTLLSKNHYITPLSSCALQPLGDPHVPLIARRKLPCPIALGLRTLVNGTIVPDSLGTLLSSQRDSESATL
jgi:hypothetical protein